MLILSEVNKIYLLKLFILVILFLKISSVYILLAMSLTQQVTVLSENCIKSMSSNIFDKRFFNYSFVAGDLRSHYIHVMG